MAEYTLSLFPKGWPTLVLEKGFPGLIRGVNNKRVAQGLPPLNHKAAKAVWTIHVAFYFSHFNPVKLNVKTQKAYNNAIRMIEKHDTRMEGYFTDLLQRFPDLDAHWKRTEITGLTEFLESQIPAEHNEHESFWAKDWTPLFVKGRKLIDPFLFETQQKLKKMEIEDEEDTIASLGPMGVSGLVTPPRKIWGAERPTTPTHEELGGAPLEAPWGLSPKQEKQVERLGLDRKRGRDERKSEDQEIDVKMGGVVVEEELVGGDIKKAKF